jgi:hypothetical protein
MLRARSPESRSHDPEAVVLAFNNIFDGAEPILPAASRSRRIEWCHIKFNAGGGEINANPVDEPTALVGYHEPLTPIGNACENLYWLVRVTLLPKVPVEESA